MRAPKAFWAALVFAIGGCTQILELDQEYRPDGTGGAGGMGGTGGASPCVVNTDCPPALGLCTANTCVNNTCVPGNAPAGTSCAADGTIVCDGNGICGDCNQASDCTMLPPDDECQMRVCDNHVCSQSFTPNGTLLSMQVTGDCKSATCDGSGKTTSKDDNMDLPEDNDPCTKNVCKGGEPSHPLEPADTSCGTDLFCNAVGQCIGCTIAADCSGADDFCKTRTCTNQMCGLDLTPAGTDLPSGQTSGDCKIVECNGQGNSVPNPDNTDLPVDNNPCTEDKCTAGVPSHPNEAAGTPCPNGTCNGMGACEKPNGATCMMGAQCQSGFCADGYCCDVACGQTCKSCGVPGLLGQCSTVPAGFTDDTCQTTKFCDGSTGAGSCINKFANGAACLSNTYCANNFCVDGVCCNTNCVGLCQACSAALKGSGTNGTCGPIAAGTDPGNECATQVASTCGTTGACSGSSTCSIYPSGTTCAAQSCAGSTQSNTDTCNGMGTCVDAGSTSCAPYTCGATTCKTSCAVDSDCLSTHYCSVNVCVPKLANGNTCSATNQCTSGACVDSVCCNTGCAGTCQACNVMGSVGTCTNVPLGQDDAGTCTGVNSCNGAGACLLDAGQPCTLSTECVSNNCLGMICQP